MLTFLTLFDTDATKHTFKELRHMLCYNTTNAGHMKKRSLVFQEGNAIHH